MKFEDFYKNRRILITGHTGFICSWLTKWLTMLDVEVCGYALDPPTEPNLYEVLNLKRKVSKDILRDFRNILAMKHLCLLMGMAFQILI